MKMVNLEEVSCNLCKSKESRILYKANINRPYRKEMFYPTSSTFKTENIVKCKNCGLVFANPRPKRDSLTQFYFSGEDEKYIEQQKERSKTFQKVMKFIETFQPCGRILDIGCGAGFLLSVAKEKGWQVKGIELNQFFTNFAVSELKVDAINDMAENVELKPNLFDVIVIWDTLEHVLNPYEILSKAHSWLKKGGYIFINFPNINSIFARVFRRKWWFIESMHLYYFSPDIINKYFNKIGFKYLQKKRHIQTLKLGYLISKLRPHRLFFYNIISNVIKFVKLQDLDIQYYAGQLIIVGQK